MLDGATTASAVTIAGTIAGSLFVSIVGMLLTNAMSAGWRANKITEPLRLEIASLRDMVSNRSGKLHERIEEYARDLDDKIEAHLRDDGARFDSQRREFGETGMAIREQMRINELWNRDHFLLEKNFDEKIARIMDALAAEGKIAVARHETVSAGITECRTSNVETRKCLALMDTRLAEIERNGNGHS